jgi:ATP-dependent DNA helicase RecG
MLSQKPNPSLKLSDSIDSMHGVGDKTASAFKARGIKSIRDLLFYLPNRHEDYSVITPINRLRPGRVTIRAVLKQSTIRRGRRGLSITEAIASDTSGSVRVVWFNQPYRLNNIRGGHEYFLSGDFKLGHKQLALINPYTEIVSDLPVNSARIIPIYPETKVLNSAMIRRAMIAALPLGVKIKDYCPRWLVQELKLMTLNRAITQMHYPESEYKLNSASCRLQFDELFPILLANELSRKQRELAKTLKVPFKVEIAKEFVSRLPFKLTDDQRKIIWQIYMDMQGKVPMNRLVEGDVGSGKTVVAVMAAVMAVSEGYKIAFMAPTELLAVQHATTIKRLLEPLGLVDHLVLLTGSMKNKNKRSAIDRANKTNGAFIVGTHSLLTSGIDWKDLALVIIDEQHRFGVDQRQQLQKSAGYLPHCLSITATPIPRSLALTIFNDLELSRLVDLPQGRRPIKSFLTTPSDLPAFFKYLTEQLSNGRQAYVVCPYIQSKTDHDQLSVESVYAMYQKKLPKYRVGLIHGQLSAEQQQSVMHSFIKGEIAVLVATTVIEVGVDVANASVMAIYGPERFGLAQLHQLRGRIGRGEYESHCYLILSDSLEPSHRLRQFINTENGFVLSELDLALRGPGAIYGKLQHGKTTVRLMNLDNQKVVELAKRGAISFLNRHENVLNYPSLAKRVKLAQQLTYLN